jgi:hypothetical protein
MKRLIGFIWVFVVFCALAAGQQSRADYVEPTDFDFKTLLPTPPADHSDAWRTEMDQLLKLQDKRTDDDLKRIESEQKMTAFIFSKALGPWFNQNDLPKSAEFLGKVMKDTSDVVAAGKALYQRPRPFTTEPKLHPCSEKEKTFSYPSSHSTRAMVAAMVLSEMLPDQKKALMAEGTQIGDDRALAGQHYPSDVDAGRVLARAIFDKLNKDPKFQKQLEEAKAECIAKEPVSQAAK